MIPAAFDYEVAESADHAVSLLGQHGEDAKLLAGGHSLLPLMKLRLAVPAGQLARTLTALHNGVSLLTGGITPPVGMYLFIICGVDGTPLRATFKYIIPFLLCELIVIAFMSVFPQISYFVPGLMGLV